MSVKAWILAHPKARLAARVRRSWPLAVVAGLTLTGVVGAIANVSQTPTLPASLTKVVEDLGRPQGTTTIPLQAAFVHEEIVEPGDTIVTLFQRLGIDDDEAMSFLSSNPNGRNALRQLRAGRSVTAVVSPDRRLEALSLPMLQAGEHYRIERAEGALREQIQSAATTTLVEMRSGVIEHSLFAATDSVGLPDAIAMRLADLFGTHLDFHTDIRTGDRFSVVYETQYQNGHPVGVGRVLAAEFVNDGKTYRLALYRGPDGHEDYYSEDGHSPKQAFLRSPLAFTRVTSGFSMRMHPILKQWRQHKGVDFGAPIGTPVKATSDGIVDFVGVQRGYGNFVVLKHRNGYSTAYGHLSRFAAGLHKGERVEQGEVIAYVGMTGWATGPHLHYEFRVAGAPKDPMSVALPTAQPLSKQELAQFKAATGPLFARLQLIAPRTVASLD